MKRHSLLIVLFCLLWTDTLMATEEPEFELLHQEGNFEVRLYAPMIVAETVVDGDMDSATSSGFRRIAAYIFGNNERIAMTAPVVTEAQGSAEKIAMTAPVSVEPQDVGGRRMAGAQSWRIHFVMPGQYTLATLPKPLDPQVQLREIPAKTFAALRYSGTSSERVTQEKTDQLVDWLKAKGVEAIGQPQLARYNPPWTLPFWRRNEILQEIRWK